MVSEHIISRIVLRCCGECRNGRSGAKRILLITAVTLCAAWTTGCPSDPVNGKSESEQYYMTSGWRHMRNSHPGVFDFSDDPERIFHEHGNGLVLFDMNDLNFTSVLQDVSSTVGIRDFCYVRATNNILFTTDPDHLDYNNMEKLHWVRQDLVSWTIGSQKTTLILPNIGYTFGCDASSDGRTIVYSATTNPKTLAADIRMITVNDSYGLREKRLLTETDDHEILPFLFGNNEGIVFFRAGRYGSNSPIATPTWRCLSAHMLRFKESSEFLIADQTHDRLYWPSISRDRRWFFYATNNNELSNLKFNDMTNSVYNKVWPKLREMFPLEGNGPFERAYELLGAQFTYDSKGFVIAIKEEPDTNSRQNPDFVVVRLDLESGEVRRLTTLPHTAEGFICSADEKSLCVFDEKAGVAKVEINVAKQ